MNPAIIAPDAFDIVDIGVEKGMHIYFDILDLLFLMAIVSHLVQDALSKSAAKQKFQKFVIGQYPIN